jgi:hypothetical protein
MCIPDYALNLPCNKKKIDACPNSNFVLTTFQEMAGINCVVCGQPSHNCGRAERKKPVSVLLLWKVLKIVW